MIHVSLVSAYPTEAAARAGLGDLSEQYRGIWRMPQPYGGVVHLFCNEETDVLVTMGWELLSSALPGDAPWTGEGS